MRRLRTERILICLSLVPAVVVPTATALDLQFPGRAVVVLAFLLTVPGVPVVSLLRVPDGVLASSLSGAVSIAATLLTGTASILFDAWNPLAWSTGLAAVHLAIASWALMRTASPAGTPAQPAAGAPTDEPRHGRLVERALCAAALLAALMLWWLATTWVDLDDAGATGLAGVVGWPYVLALVLVTAVAAAQLVRPRLDAVMLTAAALVLTVVIFGFVNVADASASVPTGWHHVGFARFITDNETSFYGLDARASWPGFFAAAAGMVALAGVPDASAFLPLAPLFYNAAAIAPLLVVARAVTGSRRLAWLSVFVYLGANWFQQDYFAPQATAFLLYLVVLATLMWTAGCASGGRPIRTRSRHAGVPSHGVRRHLGRAGRLVLGARRIPELPPGMTSGRSAALEATLLFLAAAIVVSHQLTPITLFLTLAIFVVTGYTRYRRLWLVIALLFLGWFSYGAADFWSGHLRSIFADFGRVSANLDSAVTSRVVGDPTYQVMQNVRLGWALAYGLLALAGLWAIRRRPHALLVALLAASTGSLVVMQSYGGEVVLRVFLFAAPLLAPLAALALRGLTRRGVVTGVAMGVVLLLYGTLGTATRGVNVAFERIPQDDVAAARILWAHMRAGDTVGYLYPTGAYLAARVDQFDGEPLSEGTCLVPPLQCAEDRTPQFILLSRSQDAAMQLLEGAPPGSATKLAEDLVRQGLYRYLYQGPDSVLLVREAQPAVLLD